MSISMLKAICYNFGADFESITPMSDVRGLKSGLDPSGDIDDLSGTGAPRSRLDNGKTRKSE